MRAGTCKGGTGKRGRVVIGMQSKFKNVLESRVWWYTPVIPALGRQRQADFCVRGQPGLQSEFKDSQGYTEEPCLEKQKQKEKRDQNKDITFLGFMVYCGGIWWDLFIWLHLQFGFMCPIKWYFHIFVLPPPHFC